MKALGEFAYFKTQSKTIRTLLVTNLLFAMVLPLIEIFAGAYIMRNTGSPSWVVIYQLSMYVGIVLSALVKPGDIDETVMAELFMEEGR